MLQTITQNISNKDIKININRLLSMDDEQSLAAEDRAAIALAVAITLKNSRIINAIETNHEIMDDSHKTAAKLCAETMAMNNMYYRSIHLIDDNELTSTPVSLRMQNLMQHGIDKSLFELMSLSVSAINGCGMCLQSHFNQLKAHYNSEQIAIALKIAATMHALSLHLAYAELMGA